jgi:NAD(P)-dependent dehydrogenase (short-subunit alcohol dehydrogenase family)
MSYEGKSAVVTGGAAGIGRAAAEMLAQKGASLIIGDIDETLGEQTASEIRSRGGKALFLTCDISKEDNVQAMVDLAVEKFGKLDLAFNNAGIAPLPVDTDTMSADYMDKCYSVMVRGTFLCLKHEIASMLKTGGGAIVNVTSTLGIQAFGRWTGYVATKHAIAGMTKAVAIEYAQRNIRINAIAPGPALTALHSNAWDGRPHDAARDVPMGRIAMPAEIAEAAVWLLGPQASFVTGINMPVDGGATIKLG